MSNSQNTATKLGSDDECQFPSEGYISGSNLTTSEDISAEDQRIDSFADEGFASGHISGRSDDDPKKHQQMRLESNIIDVCTEGISTLDLDKRLNLNNLDAPTTTNLLEKYYTQDDDGDTVLHIAVEHGFVEVAQGLIRQTPHPRLLDTLNDDAQSALHLAAATAQPKIARLLRVAGANPMPRNLYGDSPLHISARMGDVNCCRAIVEGVEGVEQRGLGLPYTPPVHRVNLEQWNYDGQTPAHVAASYGNIEVLRLLQQHNADMNAREGRSGYTILHIAIERRDEALIQFLLYECQSLDVEAVTYGGRSALQLGYPVTDNWKLALEDRGVPSYYSSDDEDIEDSDSEYYDNSTPFKMSTAIIDASA